MEVRDSATLGALVRDLRRRQGLTQAQLAERVGVGREWVVRLERGHPRLEVAKVLDALAALGSPMVVGALTVDESDVSDDVFVRIFEEALDEPG